MRRWWPAPWPSNGDAVFEVDPTNASSIADGLVTVATDESSRKDLVVRGRSRAAELTWQYCAEEHIKVWESLL